MDRNDAGVAIPAIAREKPQSRVVPSLRGHESRKHYVTVRQPFTCQKRFIPEIFAEKFVAAALDTSC